MLNISIEQKMRCGFGLALAFLLMMGILSSISASRFRKTLASVDHTQEVLRSMRISLTGLLSMETAARGYLLTGDGTLLEPLGPGLRSVLAERKKLRTLTADSAEQQARLDRYEVLADRKVAQVEDHIQLRQKHDLDAARLTGLQQESKKNLDQIRLILAEMERDEEGKLQQRTGRAQRLGAITDGVVMGGMGLAASLVLAACVVLQRDAKKRREAERALEKATRELETSFQETEQIMANSLDVICTVNGEGRFVKVSAASRAVWGYDPGELIGRRFIDFVDPQDRERSVAAAAAIEAGQATTDFENRYVRKDGKVAPMMWSATWSKEDRVTFCVARDCSERKAVEARLEQMHEELQHRAAELESINKELEAFSYSVSHDLRAPLRHLGGYVDLMIRHSAGGLDAKSQRYLGIIADSGRQMGCLIDDLLLFSKTSRSEMKVGPVNLDTVVVETIQSLEPETRGRRVEWKRARLPVVQGDHPMLRLVWVNLLGNAVKYTSGRETAQIEIGCERAGKEEVFFVRDNGAGFDMEYAHKLFGIFQRLHRSDEFEGTGIGLANVRRIVQRHGGRTWAEGKLGEGATFYFSLPAREERATPDAGERKHESNSENEKIYA